MKKLLVILLCTSILYAAPKKTTLVIEEVQYFHDTSIQLCHYGKKGYVLVINNINSILESLVVYEDTNYTARQAYGELYLAYYNVKTAKKETAEYEGEKYTIQLENLEGERLFLESLTDESLLKKYKSFCYIDQNGSKDEKLTFIDGKGEQEEDTIGSAAGYLMKIDATEFIELIGEIKK